MYGEDMNYKEEMFELEREYWAAYVAQFPDDSETARELGKYL